MRLNNFKPKWCILITILLLAAVLRIIWLDRYPISPYSDEVDQAYNAYSVLKTAKDEHGVFLPVSFRSFGDWKPPLQTYLMVPSIALLGLNVFALRLPGALLSILSILVSYLLVKTLFSDFKFKEKLALLTALLLTISPWHLHESRMAMLVSISLFFSLLGFYLFLRSLIKKEYLPLSVLSFSLSLYAYYGMRLIIPIFCLYLLIKYKKNVFADKKMLIISLITGFIILLPLFIGFIYSSDVVFGRAKSVSIFYDKGVKLRLWEMQSQDGVSGSSILISRLFHNKPYLYGLDILRRFLVHFEGNFLFQKGDPASPFRIPNMGVLYLAEAVFFLLGLISLIKNKENNRDLILIWLVLGILPASLTFMTPSQNRTFNSVFAFSVLISYGLINLCTADWNKYFKFIKVKELLVIIYILSFSQYLVNYYKILPYKYASEWLYGFRELTVYINKEDNNFSKIIFLPQTGMSYVYILFYNKYPPQKYMSEANHVYQYDEVGFEHVNSFNKYYFQRITRSWEVIQHRMEKGEMYIGRNEEIPKEFSRHEIYYPNGEVAFRITYL